MNRPADQGSVPAGARTILIVDDKEWPARALESILEPQGYAVLRAYNGAQAIELALGASPDAIFLDVGLPDMSGLDVTRTVNTDPRYNPAVPLIVTTAEAANRPRRLEALEAGAWEFVALPPDAPELLAKLNTWIRAKREADRIRDEGLLDAVTGLYNVRGLLQRAAELAAEASRYEKPLACVVVTTGVSETVDSSSVDPALLDRIRDALRATLRTCDTIGRIGTDQFAVLAPGTDEAGAARLAERALQSLDRETRDLSDVLPFDLHAGYFGVPDFRAAKVDSAELLARATIALHSHQQAKPGQRIVGYGTHGAEMN